VSDIDDYTSFDNVYGEIRVNSGQADQIASIHPYSHDSFLVFMRNSIHRIYNFTADLSLTGQDLVSDELGAVGREAVVQVGADAIFLARSGFYRVNQVFENQTVAAPVPISDRISPEIDNISWETIPYLGNMGMVMLGDYLFAAIPIGLTYPRNVFVYNTVTSEWESIDAWNDTNLVFNQIQVTNYGNQRRVFGINWVTPKVYLLYEGVTDQTGVTNPVNDIIETRGYGGGQEPHLFKQFKSATVIIRTRNPSINLFSLTDGYNEEKTLTAAAITKSTTKFYTWGHKDFVAGDNPDEPKRMDYYLGSETDWVAQDMSNLFPGIIDLLPGVEAEMMGGPLTESVEHRLIRRQGRWCSIRVDNRQGACDVVGVEVDYQIGRKDSLTHA
jgi:hypothetical protein